MLTRPPNWLAGTLELASKVRYGLTSRGVPLYRFIPYDKRIKPLAVGCSSRELFYNIHAIVEPTPGAENKGTLVQNLGKPTPVTERLCLLTTYAYDSQKDLRKETQSSPSLEPQPDFNISTRIVIEEGFTFHIDPPGCVDVDDAFTFVKTEEGWTIWIHIADVAAWIPQNSPLDIEACRRATTFYTLEGEAIAPMLPRSLGEQRASLRASGEATYKPALSLRFVWTPGQPAHSFTWFETMIVCQKSFTYDEADAACDEYEEIQALRDFTDREDSHGWVEAMMILYNTHAGAALKQAGVGLLRRHSEPQMEKLASIPESLLTKFGLHFLAFDSAEHCLASEPDTCHFGLAVDAYAYMSSPLRRYVDLVNQRIFKSVLLRKQKEKGHISKELVEHLNRRDKQSRAFRRDLFFSTELATADAATSETGVKGVVLAHWEGGFRVYVEAWRKLIKVRCLEEQKLKLGTPVMVRWFEDRTKAGWKEKIVFQARAAE